MFYAVRKDGILLTARRLSMNQTRTNKEKKKVPKKQNGMKYLGLPYIIWMAGFIIIPLLMIVYYGLTDKAGSFTFDNVILNQDYITSLLLSLKLSIICTIVCLLLAYPLAMILANKGQKSNSMIIMIFILPMWMNFLLRTIAWQNILENTGILNQILKFLHLPTVNLINTPTAIVLGMVYNFLPFMILPLYNTLAKLDKNIINAARDLGANSVQTFIKIIFPLSIPGVISGITMVFVPSLTTFVISAILGGGKQVLIGNMIEQQFKTVNDWHAGSGLSLVLMVFILISMAILSKYDKDSEGTSVW